MLNAADKTNKVMTFSGITAGIRLDVDGRFLSALPLIFCKWPFVLQDGWSGDILAAVSYDGKKYTVSSDFMDKPQRYSDPVNALCCLIVELAWAHLRDAPDLLCLHGAAVEINGRLVVLPSTRRAGKSTLSVALLAAGHRLFTDDFLPLSVDGSGQILGIAQGISPRIRLPFPDQIGPRAKAYIQERAGVSNAQYRYVQPGRNESAAFGCSAPVGALVILERNPGATANLREIGHSEALKTLIKQNFSRAMIADGILETLSATVETTPAYRLEYDQVEPAIDLLQSQFSEWANQPAMLKRGKRRTIVPAPKLTKKTTGQDWRLAVLGHADDVFDVNYGPDRFLAAGQGREIHHLNSGATAIWQLLSEPASLPEVVEMLAAAFPDQPGAELASDVESTLATFVKNGLIQIHPGQIHPGVCHGDVSLKECQHGG